MINESHHQGILKGAPESLLGRGWHGMYRWDRSLYYYRWYITTFACWFCKGHHLPKPGTPSESWRKVEGLRHVGLAWSV